VRSKPDARVPNKLAKLSPATASQRNEKALLRKGYDFEAAARL